MITCLYELGQFDRNFDGHITISDIFGTIKAFANLPAEILIDSMSGGEIYRFLELSVESCTSNAAFFLSILIWIVLGYFAVKTMGYSNERARQKHEEKKRDMGY